MSGHALEQPWQREGRQTLALACRPTVAPLSGATRRQACRDCAGGRTRRLRRKERENAMSAQDHSAEHYGGGEPYGLYDPALEKDSCGVGFIANIKGRKSHQIVEDALAILCNLEHRGAVGADPRAGDGAGILVQIPHEFFASKAERARLRAARARRICRSARCSCRATPTGGRSSATSIADDQARGHDAARLARRADRQLDARRTVKPTEPVHLQVFIGRGRKIKTEDEFERRLYILRKSISQRDLSAPRARGLSGYYPGVDVLPHRRSTRACSWPTSSAPIIPTCTTRISRARSRSCISASRPTPSRPGRWRIPTG